MNTVTGDQTRTTSTRIFICYRRQDSGGQAGRLYDTLVSHFGEEPVFHDVDSDIEPGADFVAHIEEVIRSCDVLLALIGPEWLTCRDAEGRRRLDDAEDLVRLELAQAFAHGLRVIPVLVRGGAMPRGDALPEKLARLRRLQAFELHDAEWRTQVVKLIETLERMRESSVERPPSSRGRRQPASMAQARFDVTLLYGPQDREFMDGVARQLEAQGIASWPRSGKLEGHVGEQQIAEAISSSAACAVCISASHAAWDKAAAAVAFHRAAIDPGFRVFAVLLPGVPDPIDAGRLPPFLAAGPWVDLRRDTAAGVARLVAAVRGIPPARHDTEPHVDVPPYRGLQRFDEEHANRFFGRDGDVQLLLEKLKRSTFLAVLGSSGSGKSSLVRAGLVPALRGGALGPGNAWEIRVFAPGPRPLDALTLALRGLHEPGLLARRDMIARDPGAVRGILQDFLATRPAGHRVLLVVDQAEEMFTLCTSDDERAAFVDAVVSGSARLAGRGYVVLVLRSDFHDRLAQYPELARRVGAEQFLVGPLTRDGLRQAIEEPARRAGLELEEGLATAILDEIGSNPTALPLIQHGLATIWSRRRGRKLTLQAYREAGGVAGAVATHAERIYAALEDDEREAARRILLRLVEPGIGTEDRRRLARVDELASGPRDALRVSSVLDRLAAARLVTVGGNPSEGAWVELAHEALLRSWPRLREWIDTDRESLRIRGKLTDDATEWVRYGRDEGVLYRGPRLDHLIEWRARHDPELSSLEREFLDASARLPKGESRSARRRRLPF